MHGKAASCKYRKTSVCSCGYQVHEINNEEGENILIACMADSCKFSSADRMIGDFIEMIFSTFPIIISSSLLN